MVFAKMPRFPEKLWTVATTDPTGSVWFNEAGDKLLIDWSLFELHYVGRFLIFAIKLQTIKTQLYHYGFHQFYCGSSLLQNSRRSSTTLRGYQHPDFHRDQPEWLSRMHKKRYGWKPSTDHSYAYGIYTNNNCDGSQRKPQLSGWIVQGPQQSIRLTDSLKREVESQNQQKQEAISQDLPAIKTTAVMQEAEQSDYTDKSPIRQIVVHHSSSSHLGVDTELWEVEPTGAHGSFQLYWCDDIPVTSS